MRRAPHSSTARRVSERLATFPACISTLVSPHDQCQRMPVCPFTRVVPAAAAIPSTSPEIPTIPSHSGIPTTPASIAATTPAVQVVPGQARLATPNIIRSMSTPAAAMPARMPAASIAMAKPGRTTYRCGPRSGRHMNRVSYNDAPAGSPATACPRTAPTTDAVVIAKGAIPPERA